MSETEWPRDAEGNPLSKVTASVSEKIPTAKYASVDIFMSVTKWADPGDEEAGLEDAYTKADKTLQVKHDEILEELQKGNS
jgi:hypothetical protein